MGTVILPDHFHSLHRSNISGYTYMALYSVCLYATWQCPSAHRACRACSLKPMLTCLGVIVEHHNNTLQTLFDQGECPNITSSGVDICSFLVAKARSKSGILTDEPKINHSPRVVLQSIPKLQNDESKHSQRSSPRSVRQTSMLGHLSSRERGFQGRCKLPSRKLQPRGNG